MEMQAVLQRIPPEIAAKLQSSISQGESWIDRERQHADALNTEPGSLTGYDCPLCLNRGFFWRVRESGERYCEECACMETRRNLRYMRNSGLSELAKRYTFSAWQTKEAWQQELLKMAQEYAQNPRGWFYLAGQPGAGKTHLCTAICTELIQRGFPVRYMLWRDISVRAKAVVNDEEKYQELVKPLKAVRVLYVDDLFKTGKGQEPSAGDVNLAFEVLNARYNDARKLTLISSELSINRILEIDEAVGSRIYERSSAFYADLTGKANWRLSGG